MQETGAILTTSSRIQRSLAPVSVIIELSYLRLSDVSHLTCASAVCDELHNEPRLSAHNLRVFYLCNLYQSRECILQCACIVSSASRSRS